MNAEKSILNQRSYRHEHCSHQHSYHQLVLPLHGGLVMQIAGRENRVEQSRAAVVAAGETHSFEALGENAFLVADMPVEMSPQLASLPAFLDLDETLMQYVRFIRRQLQTDQQSPLIQRQILVLLVEMLCQRFAAVRPDQRVFQARSFIERHFAATLSLDELARQVNLSPRQLTGLFRQQLNTSPGQYQLQLRMEQAQRLLRQGQMSVQQVAEQVGYASLSAFSDRYRRFYGCSPREERSKPGLKKG
ncbi:helix-turn-helix domain-containing protein [Marinobacterium jannaschii]|uniref:helix-turn-helix domain-containing protein n=1 Tax=Marinobacterium jannaschii TaxID=64970 RepID=UPI000488FD8C|nr:AraC family transcriptional regulator [Marinobacterium jannaschii]